MGRIEFANLVYDNLLLYIFILIFISWVYYKILKPLYLFLLDPFIIYQIYSIFATSVVFFLFFVNEIDLYYFVQFLFSQIAYWMGLYFFNFKKVKEQTCLSKEQFEDKQFKLKSHLKSQTKYLYLYLSFIFIFLQLLTYIKMGIPLFLSSRLTLYEGSGGWGILGRILDILIPIVIIGSFYIRNYFNKERFLRYYTVIILMFAFIVHILSGSKGAILNFFTLYFLFLLMYTPSKIGLYRKYEKYAVLFTLLGVFLIFSIHDSGEHPILSFLNRLIGSGDVFYQGYFDDKIQNINGTPIALLFTDILGTYRIIPWNELPRPIGMQLYNMVYNVDLSMGANARHNYLGLICFGFVGSIIFSYLIGCLLSYIRAKLYMTFFSKGFILVTFYILILQGVIYAETDFTMFISRLNSMFVTYSFLLFSLIFFFLTSYFIGFFSNKTEHE